MVIPGPGRSSRSDSPAPACLRLEIVSTPAGFDALAGSWAGLLCRSQCDPLFNSWPWQRAWWQIWSDRFDLQLHIIAVFHDRTADPRLVGLLPICFSPRDNAYAFLGALPRSTFRSELLDALVDPEFEDSVYDRLSSHLASLLRSANFYAIDVPRRASIRKIIRQLADARRLLLLGEIVTAEDTVFEVDCSAGFERYVSQLGKNSRLKLFNRRTYLQQQYPETAVMESRLTERPEVGMPGTQFLSFQPDFEHFHQQRWNKSFLGKDGLVFQTRFLDLCVAWNALAPAASRATIVPIVSVLQHQSQPISLLYDIVVGDTRYNMQMGFDEAFDKKLSLGTLHLGYAIEAACSQGLASYNFLAGSGRLTEASYKTHLATSTHSISSSCTAANQRFLEVMSRDLARHALQPLRRLLRR